MKNILGISKPDYGSEQVNRLQRLGVAGFAQASAYGCGRNPIDMMTLKQTGQTLALQNIGMHCDIR